MEGKRAALMGDGIHRSRIRERFSSHTQMRPRAAARGTYGESQMLREKLIQATVEVVGEGSDPRLVKSQA